MTQACIYCRFSPRPDAEQCDSNRKQFQRCRKYCEAHGYEIVAVRWDRDMSGGRADNRPGLQRVMRDACRHKAILVVYSLDRFARDTGDALDLLDQLHSAGADLAMLIEGINTRTPMGYCMFTVVAAFKRLERDQIRERTSRAMLFHQARGRRMTRLDRCPYGKRPSWDGPKVERVDKSGQKSLVPAELIDDLEEQAVIVRICQERQQGKGLRAIARTLEEAGIDCRGRSWSHSTVRAILRRARQFTEGSSR